MTSRKKQSLTYLQVPLPSASEKAKIVKKSWSGYNRRQTVDTGMLSFESNISTVETPYLVPSMSHRLCEPDNNFSDYQMPIGLFGFADFLLVIYAVQNKSGISYTINVDYRTKDENGIDVVYTGIIKSNATFEECEKQRCVVPFNVYDVTTDPIEGEYTRKLLIFPDKVSMDFDIGDETEFNEDGYFPIDYLGDTYPDIKYATVHLSRLFGVDDVRVYASGFNDYANWELDTADEYNESNAWCSATGANTKAGGEFTGITTFQGHVVCFKKDFMHEIYNTKNPFRIQDIYAEGSIDNRTIADVDGQLVFVSEDNVKVYTGSNPRILSYYLGIDKYIDAVSGTDGRNYYLFCRDEDGKNHIFVYDTHCSHWSRQECPFGDDEESRIVGFAHCDMGMFYLCNGDGKGLYKIDSGEYDGEWSFETDLITSESCDIKHIEKIQMFCDISKGANMQIYLKYDGKNELREVWSCDEAPKNLQKVIRVKPRMTSHHGFKVCVSGNGFVRIRSMELLLQGGGDLYV